MEIKGKLVRILDDCWEVTMTVEGVADVLTDVLISNGVTTQEWVSVDEPPKKTGIYQVFMWDKDWSKYRVWYAQFVLPNHWFAYSLDGDYIPCEIIHWQPLPEPPKGVQ